MTATLRARVRDLEVARQCVSAWFCNEAFLMRWPKGERIVRLGVGVGLTQKHALPRAMWR